MRSRPSSSMKPHSKLKLNFNDYDDKKKANPYDMPDDKEVFKIRGIENDLKINEQKQFMKKPLMYRNCPSAASENLPSLLLSYEERMKKIEERNFSPEEREIQKMIKAFDPESNGGVTPVPMEFKRNAKTKEYIDQKFQIFIVQLLINRKQKEIERIKQQQNSENAFFKDQESKIAETQNQYKMTINQLEAELSRLTKTADAAAKQKSELAASLKIKKARLQTIENEMVSNEETAKIYRIYHNFIKQIEIDYDRETIFKNPQLILEILENLEEDNLFLFEKCAKLAQDQERIVNKITTEIDNTRNEDEKLKKETSNLQDVEIIEFNSSLRTPEVIALDDELARITVIVSEAYAECFGRSSDLSPLMMLERLENDLEVLYSQCNSIPEKDINENLNAKERERREKQRKEKQIQQQLELQAKNDAIIARAKMPIKRKTGRPLNKRYIPIKVVRQVRKNNAEELYLENLLYGNIDY